MAMIYKITNADNRIGHIYYYERDAIESATRISIDTGKTVAIWETEEIEGTPVDRLEWSINRLVKE